MTFDQIYLISVLACVVILFIWGRWRHDLVAMGALLAVAVGGQITASNVFSGFASPATVTVALVLIASRGLVNAGAVSMISRNLLPEMKSPTGQIGLLSAVGGGLSSFMNNVGALAMLMPAALKTARDGDFSPSLLLMPLAFGSILGGLVTLIGTPPNIIIASIREEAAGAPFSMFDYSPVGGAVAVAGILFITLIGWRLIPNGSTGRTTASNLQEIDNYVTEVRIPEDHKLVGQELREIDTLVADQDAVILGILRGERRLDPATRRTLLRTGDNLLIEAGPEEINAALSALDLRPPAPPENDNENATEKDEKPKRKIGTSDVTVIEAVVQPRARIIGRTLGQIQLRALYGINLLAIARQGRPYRGRIREFRFSTGDMILVEGEASRISEILRALGCLPLSERSVGGSQAHLTWLAIALFGGAIAATTLGFLSFPIALSLAVLGMTFSRIVPVRELYDDIDWSVVVLLGAMIPVGQALQETGTTTLIANGIGLALDGYSPVVALAAILIVTMFVSDIINNAATAVVMAPVALDLADRMAVNPDSFLMAVAIGASCAFLTPIGHQNNALILGPGGYRFSDYWRMGLPLEIVIVAVAIPMLLLVWPL